MVKEIVDQIDDELYIICKILYEPLSYKNTLKKHGMHI